MLRGGVRLALVAALLLLDVGCGPTPSAGSDSLEARSEFEVDAKEAPPEKFPLFGPFVKHHGIVLAPRSNQSFWCPWMQQPLLWESKDVFNPAVVVSGTPPTVKVTPPALSTTTIRGALTRMAQRRCYIVPKITLELTGVRRALGWRSRTTACFSQMSSAARSRCSTQTTASAA